VRTARPHQVLSHVIHAVMMPRPEGRHPPIVKRVMTRVS
jgi:hypothetical protein